MKNTDTRVRYTKDMLKKALLKIMEHKHIDRITVKELCDEAEINRGTFYLHYATPNDVLMEIEDEIFAANWKKMKKYQKDPTQINYLQDVFRTTLENRDIARIIMGQNGNARFMERIKKNIKKEVVDQWCIEMPDLKKKDLDYVFDYVFNGTMALIINWMNDESISIEKLSNRLDRLGHYAQLATKEFI